jgi:hypothetical protein
MSNRALPEWFFEWDGGAYLVASRDPRASHRGPFRCADAADAAALAETLNAHGLEAGALARACGSLARAGGQ